MEYDDNGPDSKRELRPQSVDPKKGWEFRGVHRVWISYIFYMACCFVSEEPYCTIIICSAFARPSSVAKLDKCLCKKF